MRAGEPPQPNGNRFWIASSITFKSPRRTVDCSSFTAADEFSGGLHASPFLDVRLAVFKHDSGRTLEAQGFYDGDRTWRIRFMPLEAGRWTYSTRSNDPN